MAVASFALGTLAGQVVSLTMGALVPLLTALLVRDLRPRQRWLPLLAGALVALSGQLWQSSMVLMADTSGLAIALLAAWAVVRYGRERHVAWLLVATLAIVLALLSRWIYGLVALPLALYVLSSRPRPWHVIAAAVFGAAVLAPILGPA